MDISEAPDTHNRNLTVVDPSIVSKTAELISDFSDVNIAER